MRMVHTHTSFWGEFFFEVDKCTHLPSLQLAYGTQAIKARFPGKLVPRWKTQAIRPMFPGKQRPWLAVLVPVGQLESSSENLKRTDPESIPPAIDRQMITIVEFNYKRRGIAVNVTFLYGLQEYL
jgi:hypothetical protein